MCLRPLRIKNPTKYFRQGVDKEYLLVPCGKCTECINANRMDWQIRLYYEHRATAELHNGFTFYFTLTYNGLCPSVPVRDDKGRVVFCFNHKHIPDFIKRCRSQIVHDGVNISIRHFICSEYGDSPDTEYITDSGFRAHCTHRPHYHGLFFVSRNDGCTLSINEAADYIRGLIADKWNYGDKTFTVGYDRYGFALPAGVVSNEVGPIGYCAKYLDKGLATDEYYNSIISDERFKDFLPDLKPKHYQSQGLGREALSLVDADTLDDGFCPCPVYDEQTGLVMTRNFKLPLYLMRKVNYDFDKSHGVYVPNERGLRNLPRIMYNERQEVVKSLEDFSHLFDKNFIKGSSFADKTIEYLNELYGGRFTYDYCQLVGDVLSQYKTLDIANYITFFRDRSMFQRRNDHNVISQEEVDRITSAYGDEVSIAQLLMLGYNSEEILHMPLGRTEYYREFRRFINRSFIPAQVKSRQLAYYTPVSTHYNMLLDDFISIYNCFNLAMRHFRSLSQIERTDLYRQQRKMLKRGLHKEKIAKCFKVS